MQIISAVLVFLAIFFLIKAWQKAKETEKAQIQGRLKNVLAREEPLDYREVELSRPLSERLCQPLLKAGAALAARMLPIEILQSLELQVQQVGSLSRLTARDYLGLKLILSVCLPALVCMAGGELTTFKHLIVISISVLIGWHLPNLQLNRLLQQRHDLLEKSFPDTLDLLTVSVEAGLSFDGAMVKVVEKSSGPVAEEFKRLLQEVKMGKTRREALQDFSKRCGVADIQLFTSTIIQADQLGLNIGNTLKTQAAQMRLRRRQRVEEKAMKVPVKMLLPLIVFIFPTIFIVLLGPALIQILENLW